MSLPRTTERPVSECRDECSELPQRAVPKSHGRKYVLRGFTSYRLLYLRRTPDDFHRVRITPTYPHNQEGMKAEDFRYK